MKKNIILTLFTEFFVLASGLVVYKLVALALGKDPFYEYALVRRTVSFIQPALLLGLSIAIPRYMSFSLKSENPEKVDSFFAAGLFILLAATLAFGILLLSFKNLFAYLFFGNSVYALFILPLSLMLLGSVLHTAAYSYYRGRLLMGKANLLQFVNMALIPFGVFFLAKNSRQLFVLIGTAWTAVSAVFLIAILKNLSYERRDILPQAKKLLAYGLQRVLGDFGRAALLSLPATFTAHLSGIQKAGAVAFGISLLNMVGSVFAPIGLILLPKASQLVAAKDLDTLKYYVRRILAVTVLLTAAGILIFELFAGRILELYLGRSYSDLLAVTRIIMAGGLAYAVYVSLRSVIDAFYVKAVNTLNIFIALVLFCGLSLGVILHFKNDLLIVVGFVLAVYILGVLTLRETLKILKSMETLSSGPQTKN